MKAYLLRQPELGYDSVAAIVANTQTGIVGVRSDQLTNSLAEYDFAIRWGCTATIPHSASKKQNVLNKAEAIHNVFDKPGFRRKLHTAGLSLPVYTSASIEDDPWTYPLVVRPKSHQEGNSFYVVNNDAEYRAAVKACGKGWYSAPYVQKVAEYRVNVLQGRVLCVIEKSALSGSDLTWSKGMTTIHLWSDWPLPVVRAAVAALKLSGLDFAGVDIIVSQDGTVSVLELNSAPWLEGSYQGQVFAKGLDHIVKTGSKDNFPLKADAAETWRKYIHPAVSNSAIV